MARTLRSDSRGHPEFRAIDSLAGVWAGLVAGAVFLIAEMLMVMLIQGESPWAPPRMMAAIILGEGVLPPPATFDLAIFMAAMAVHFPLSIVYGLAIGLIVRRRSAGKAIAIGAALGLAIYFVNFYPIAAAAFPWFAMARGWVSAAAHALFGVVAAATYFFCRRKT